MKFVQSMLIMLPLLSFDVFGKTKEYAIYLKDNLFYPKVLTIPANTKVKLIIENRDDNAEEFDSFDLNREKVIYPGKKATIYVGPLTPGKYEYFGEFNPDTARGTIVVKELTDVH